MREDPGSVSPDPLDLHFQDAERVIASYVLETEDGPALYDCGPSSCVLRLHAALHQRGLQLQDLRHLLLSHVHLDHAGAAGVLVREHPALQVHVSEIGAPHLADPTRLEASARRLYGDTFDTLWGELAPVPQENIRVVGTEVLGLECFPSPGHARHHVCYLAGDGTLYAGDAAGVRLQPDRTVLPPTPPPDFDLDEWFRTIDEIEKRRPTRLALVHFGVADDPGLHLAELRQRLADWTRRAGEGVTEEQFSASARRDVTANGGDAEIYERAMPFWQSYAGLERYWEQRRAS
jgi:glyoxylase-like metal-dependent hydrolase (beta-lactamase superfamily II)